MAALPPQDDNPDPTVKTEILVPSEVSASCGNDSDPVAPFMSTVTARIEPAHRLGSLLVDSVTWRDIPVVQGCILTIVLFFLVVNIAVDVLCAVVDPRIKYS